MDGLQQLGSNTQNELMKKNEKVAQHKAGRDKSLLSISIANEKECEEKKIGEMYTRAFSGQW